MLQVGIGKRKAATVIHQMIGHVSAWKQLAILIQDDAISHMATETE
jgi:hypothetical protein